MARTPSTSDLCNAEANKAYDKLAIISENIDKLNEIANYIFDLKDWLKFNVGSYLNDYIVELEAKYNELKAELEELESTVTSNKEELLTDIDELSDSISSLLNQVNGLLLTTFDKDNNSKGATCKAIDTYLNNLLQGSFLTQLQQLLVPSGSIIIWSGSESNIPNGWVLCDGSNGTPDLRGRFVYGSDSTRLAGSKGGSATIFGSHYHYIGYGNRSQDGYHYGVGTPSFKPKLPTIPNKTVGGCDFEGDSGRGWYDFDDDTRKDNLVTSINYTNGSDTTGSEGEYLPPYYSLCYIMKV